jgi:hypothetical protein
MYYHLLSKSLFASLISYEEAIYPLLNKKFD